MDSDIVPLGPCKPSAWALAGWAFLCVELPFFIAFCAVALSVSCKHCRDIWAWWPALPGLPIALILQFQRVAKGPLWVQQIAWAVLTVMFIALLARWSHQSARRQRVLIIGTVVSCVFALVCYLLIAA